MTSAKNSTTQTNIQAQPASSVDLAAAIAAADFGSCDVTVVGYGFMGKAYVQALRSLGVGSIQVCSRSPEPLEELKDAEGVSVKSGGFENAAGPNSGNSLAIIATPTADLIAATKHLSELGYRKILVEKPVSFRSTEISNLGGYLEAKGVASVVAYNRLAYPSLIEARSQIHQDGGITSCAYTATELVREDWPDLYTEDELAHWGVANTLHVIGMAHGLIGLPAEQKCNRAGSMPWHAAGSVFVGSGVSQQGTPFSYHGDWKSKGRWSVELHTERSSYRMCPLEKLLKKNDALAEWEEVPVQAFDDNLKVGIAEQVAAMLCPIIGNLIPLISMKETAELTRFAEEVFGYTTPSVSTTGSATR